eukprot:Nitzschia sp. Nitz4//scaffold11_size288233//208316//211039//NITZ4_000800-RA/size288233-augustus-gene-0.139-mRNA-1//-1//CDS//3329534152//6378//frame0
MDNQETSLPVAQLIPEARLVSEEEHGRVADSHMAAIPPVILLEYDSSSDQPSMAHVVGPAHSQSSSLQSSSLQEQSPVYSSLLYDTIRMGYTCPQHLQPETRSLDRLSSIPTTCMDVINLGCFPGSTLPFYRDHNDRTPLHEACTRLACRHVVSALLQFHPQSLMQADAQGNTPLHLFVQNTVAWNIQHREDDTDDDTMTSTEYEYGYDSATIQTDWAEILFLLLGEHPDRHAATPNLAGNLPLHLACAHPHLPQNMTGMGLLLASFPAAVAHCNTTNHQTPLHILASHLHSPPELATSLVGALCEIDPSMLYSVDTKGWASIHYAAFNANFDFASLLCHAFKTHALTPTTGKTIVPTTSACETPLHLFCRYHPSGSVALANLFLQTFPGATASHDNKHKTPLHHLCQGGSATSLELVQCLLESQPTLAQIPDSQQYLPLLSACESGCSPQVLDVYRLAAMALTKKNDSALSLACHCNLHLETVCALVDTNQDALVHTNDYGYAPLHCVCRTNDPNVDIVQTLLEASPSCVWIKTHGGETPLHLAASNVGVQIQVLRHLVQALKVSPPPDNGKNLAKSMMSSLGNTPLHLACIHRAPLQHIELLAVSHPEWITISNNVLDTPLQSLCKNGHVEESTIAIFAHHAGPQACLVADFNGNTSLHSAIRGDTDVQVVRCLLHTFPEALFAKTIYGDTPLHLACLRRAPLDVIWELATTFGDNTMPPLLDVNKAGQTPISIAMDDYIKHCQKTSACHLRECKTGVHPSFHVVASLVKALYYGKKCRLQDRLNLIHCCLALHRYNIRVHPAFICRAIEEYPELVREPESDGNYPLHVEASIPVEKLTLLDGQLTCKDARCTLRSNVLKSLLSTFPGAAAVRNKDGLFPLSLL